MREEQSMIGLGKNLLSNNDSKIYNLFFIFESSYFMNKIKGSYLLGPIYEMGSLHFSI